MRVHFDATLDDMVDAALRAESRSNTVRSCRRVGCLSCTLVIAMIVGLVVFAALEPEPQQRLPFAAQAAVAGAAVAALVGPFWYRDLVKQRLRRYYRKLLGGAEPFRVEVELSPAGVSAKQKTGQVTLPWPAIEAVEERRGSVEIRLRHGGIIVVRARAFESEDMMRQFLHEALRCLDDARAVPDL